MESKTPRKRVTNFTSDEKALLAQLIKKKPIIESKLTDGKSVLKKKVAWDLIKEEFNCHAHVHKRDTVSLKRAWDNMKAFTRKARATERGNLIRTGGGPSTSVHSPHQGALITMVEEAAPVIICEIPNSFDSDGIILNDVNCSQTLEVTQETINGETDYSASMDILDISDVEKCNLPVSPHDSLKNISESKTISFEDQDKQNIVSQSVHPEQHARKPADYIRREAVLRIKHFEAKKRVEMQILKEKKRAGELDLEIKEVYLQKAKLELEEMKRVAEQEAEINEIRLLKAKMELEMYKRSGI